MWMLIIALGGMLINSLILYRALRGNYARKYPLFYAFTAIVLIVDIIRTPAYHLGSPLLYRNIFWPTQFLCLVVGYGVILEVIRKALDPYAGAERFARISVLAVFAAVFSFVTFQTLTHSNWTPAACYGELERDLRGVQVLVLMGVLTIVSYYRVALGRNLKGIILGYGLFIAASVISPALRSYFGAPLEKVWEFGPPSVYMTSQLIWVAALWNYSPNPAPEMPPRLESDYESLALRTKGALGAMRSQIGRAVRP
ncbi:MAG: hypothetical protein WB780_10960 [Candidatus Acidiferrales bacterium]